MGYWAKTKSAVSSLWSAIGHALDASGLLTWLLGPKWPGIVGGALLATYGLVRGGIMMWWQEWGEQPVVLQAVSVVGLYLVAQSAFTWIYQNRDRLLGRELDINVRLGSGFGAMPPHPMDDTAQDWWKIDIGGVRISNPSTESQVDLTFRLIVPGEDEGEVVLNEGWEPPSLTEGFPPVIQYLKSPLTVDPESTVPEEGYGIIRFVVSPREDDFGPRGFKLDDVAEAELEIEDLISGKTIKRGIFDFKASL